MSQSPQPDRISLNNERSIQTLARAITYSQGEFSLILVRCNYASLRKSIMRKLHQQCAVEIQELELSSRSKTLYTAISNEIGEDQPPALVVFGLETVQALDAVLASTNQVREEFRKAFAFPLVLWINDTILKKLIKQVPDLESWSSVVEFEMPSNDLMTFLQTTAHDVFKELLDVGAAPFLSKKSRELGSNSRLSMELGLAQQDLQQQGIELESELAASLEFLLGLSKASLIEESRHHYEQSLSLWPSEVHPEHQGCVYYQLGLWFRTHAVQNRSEYAPSCLQAVEYYQQALAVFEKVNRSDLVAKFMNPMGEALQRLEKWDALEPLARKSLSLNENYPNLYRKAEASSLLAEALLGKSAWVDAKQAAEQALQMLETAIDTDPDQHVEDRQGYIDWQKSFSRGWHLFALGRAQWHLTQREEAIQTLETARRKTRPEFDPPLFIQILRTLHQFYFEQKEYLKAFETRLEYRSLEQQYGFRAFVGAGRLQPQREVLNPALVNIQSKSQDKVSQEIPASGRQESINQLIERLSRADQKLIVVHGQSGVGKSSLIQAGLIPSLTPITLDTREVIAVLQQVYTNWTEHLGREMLKVLKRPGFVSLPDAVDSPPAMLEQLRKSVDQNLMVVLIFDQFEEFFFVHKEPVERKPFYEFLRQCLDIPYVKVILSLREDYLHYLLECNDRLVSLDVIGNNILDKDILFHLGNFTRKEAKSVIQKLTKETPYPLNTDLANELVKDLSEELGEVRPIELQVVGAQLQTEQITTLAQYREKGPKDALVSRFLDEVTHDCGPENEEIARLVLYLLTDENNTRPLKTREDIELEINVADKLGLILTILVKSGLVFRIPSSPSDRYQLVHDYLVIFVRQTQSTQLIAELEKEREQRQLTEQQLNEALQKQLKTARRATFTLAGLVTAVTGAAVLAFLAFANTYILSKADFSGEEELNRVISTLRAGKLRKHFPGIISEVHIKTLSKMNSSMLNLRLINQWSGHEGEITDVVFSPNGQFIATASKDNTVRLWRNDGSSLLRTVLDHQDSVVTTVSFSPDNNQLITGDESGNIRIWRINGELVQILSKKHDGPITDVTFSPDGNKIASSGEDKTIKIWYSDGKYQGTLEGHIDEVSGISFSPDSKMLISFAEFDVVRLWGLENLEEIQSFENTQRTIYLNFIPDGKAISVISRRKSVKTFSIDGQLIEGDTLFPGSGKLTQVSLFSQDQYYASIFEENGSPVPGVLIGGFFRQNLNGLEHSSGVTRFVVSPDSKLLVSVTQDDRLNLWNIESFLDTDAEANSGSTVFSSLNQKTLALQKGIDQILTSDIKNPLKAKVSFRGKLLSFDPEVKSFITYSNEPSLQIWNSETNDFTVIENDSFLTAQAINQSGSIVATGDESGKIKFWNTDGDLLKSINAHSSKVISVNFSPDSKVISSRDNRQLKLWRADGSLIKVISNLDLDQESFKTEVIFSPDSKYFITFEDKKIVKLWQSDGTFIKRLTGHLFPIETIKFNPKRDDFIAQESSSWYGYIDGKVWGTDGILKYNLKDLIGDRGGLIEFHPDGNEIFVGSSYNNTHRINRFNFSAGILPPFEGHVSSITDIAFSPDGRKIVTVSNDNTGIVWDRYDNKAKPIYLRGHKSAIRNVDFSPSGQTIASVDDEGIVKLWGIGGEEIYSFGSYSEHFSDVYNKFVKFGKNDNFLILFDSNHTAIFDKNSSEAYSFNTLELPKFSSTNEIVTMTIWEPKLNLMDDGGNLITTFEGHSDHINSAVFSPDKKMVASAGDDNTVRLWDISGKLLKTIQHEKPVNSVSFSKDGEFLATASDDKIIRIFGKDGNYILDDQGNELKLTGHTDAVTSVLFSPDGRTLASASADNTIRLWNIKTWQYDGKEFEIPRSDNVGSIFARARTNNGELDTLWFSEDGNLLAHGTNPTYVRLLNRGFRGGTWIKEATFHPAKKIPEEGLPDNKDWLTVRGNKGVIILSLGLDYSLKQACDWAIDYLRTQGEEHLCDGILEKDD